jgi:hypothetical protein
MRTRFRRGKEVCLIVLVVSGCASAGGGAGPSSGALSAKALPTVELRIPRGVGDFRFQRLQVYDDPGLGAMYRFAGPDSLSADVFVYPGPDLDTSCALDCARAALKTEHEQMLAAFEQMKRNNTVKEFHLVASEPLRRSEDAPWAIGHHLLFEVRRDAGAERSEWQVHYLPNVRLKVRSTYRETPSRVGAVAAFRAAVIGAFTAPVAPLPEAGRDSLFALLAGPWDWTTTVPNCGPRAQRFSFDASGKEFVIRSDVPLDTAGTRELRYAILDAGPELDRRAPHTIRMRMRGETRRTDMGAPVVWDLILASRERAVWRRTDWEEGETTRALLRCDRP